MLSTDKGVSFQTPPVALLVFKPSVLIHDSLMLLYDPILAHDSSIRARAAIPSRRLPPARVPRLLVGARGRRQRAEARHGPAERGEAVALLVPRHLFGDLARAVRVVDVRVAADGAAGVLGWRGRRSGTGLVGVPACWAVASEGAVHGIHRRHIVCLARPIVEAAAAGSTDARGARHAIGDPPEAEEDDGDVAEEHAGGDEGLDADAGDQLVDELHDGGGDLVRGARAGVGEEGVAVGVGAAVVGRECLAGALREGVVGEEREVDVRVVVRPGQALLDLGHLEPDEAVEDAHHGLRENSAVKGLVQHVGGVVDEGVERVVDGHGRGVDPPENLLVHVVVDAHDLGVGAVRPGGRRVVELVNHHVGELGDLAGQGGNFPLDGLQENVLAKAREVASKGNRKHEKSGEGGDVGNEPAHEDPTLL